METPEFLLVEELLDGVGLEVELGLEGVEVGPAIEEDKVTPTERHIEMAAAMDWSRSEPEQFFSKHCVVSWTNVSL